MRVRISRALSHLREWSGVMALLLVLTGGVAYAADTIGSVDIIDESILSQDLKDNEVKQSDLAANAVQTGKIANNQVFAEDVRDDTLAGGGLGAADLNPDSVGTSEVDGSLTGTDIVDGSLLGGEIADGALTGAEIADNSLTGTDIADNSLGGTEIADNSLDGAEVNESALSKVPDANLLDGLDSSRFKNIANVGNGGCQNLESSTTCTSAAITGLTAGDRVYVSAWWRWYGVGTGRDEALCSLKRGAVDLGSTRFGQLGNEHSLNDSSDTGSLIGLDTSSPASSGTYSLVCSEVNGNVNIISARVIAFRLSG